MTKKPGLPLPFTAAYVRYEASRESLNGFKHENRAVLEQYEQLRTAHNDALKEVKALYKANHDRIGKNYREFRATIRTEIDVLALYDLMGEELPELFENKIVLVRDEYKRAASSGKIPKEIIEDVESDGPVSLYGPPEQ